MTKADKIEDTVDMILVIGAFGLITGGFALVVLPIVLVGIWK